MRRSRPLCCLVLLLWACAEESPSCPEGSTLEGDKCVPAGEVSDDSGSPEPEEDADEPEPPVVEEDASLPCYLDRDHDDFGAGEPVACDLVFDGGMADDARSGDAGGDGAMLDAAADAGATAADASAAADAASMDGGGSPGADGGKPVLAWPPGVVMERGDCDDENAAVAPGAPEACDGIDNDCDGETDEGALNACGGACATVLRAAPGMPCTNEQQGVCARDGHYVCDGPDRVVCDAPAVAPGDETCDHLDNDCDGQVDEENALGATTWFRDCDGDGYAQGTQGARITCTRPAGGTSCMAWTDTQPSTNSRSWDCDDGDPRYSPATTAEARYTPSERNMSSDFNCDGQIIKTALLGRSTAGGDWFPANLCESEASCNCYLPIATIPDGAVVSGLLNTLPCVPRDQPSHLAVHVIDLGGVCTAEQNAAYALAQFCY